MSTRENATIKSAGRLAEGIYEIWFETNEIAKQAIPGQFISVYSNDGSRLLPRPISICEIEGNNLRIVYRVAGKGTEEFSKCKAGDKLNIQGPLGNGYDIDKIFSDIEKEYGKINKAILFGGGIGVPPMLELGKQLNCEKEIVLGYRNSDIFLKEQFEKIGHLTIATEDGSVGTKGNVLDAVREGNITGDVIFACGPMPMLRAIKTFATENNIPCYISLEEKMACGIGACLACVCKTTQKDAHSQVNNARVCKEGPVFDAKEVEI
ncbi:MAG: dihydroorotate dehydrogenase electron transfer subunit [Lachnospira sp.]